jgi:hypothetical protein
MMNKYEAIVKCNEVYLDACALIKIVKHEGDSSRFVRSLIYGSDLRFYSSWVAFGEFVGIYNKKEMQKSFGLANYLYNCRSIMKEFEYNKIYRIEPADDKVQFFKLAEDCLNRYAKLGGADIWHLMAALELKKYFPLSLLLSYDSDLVNAALAENIIAVDGNDLNPELLIESLKSSNRWIPSKS